MHTPGSAYRMAPCTRNSIANELLPQPALSRTRVTRPFGRPPPVTSSRPWIPVGAVILRRPPRPGGSLIHHLNMVADKLVDKLNDPAHFASGYEFYRNRLHRVS